MDAEPVRGSYPSPAILALAGRDRASIRVRATTAPPPIHHLFGLTPVESGDGTAVFEMPASPWLQTDAGLFIAGTCALVADAPLGAAILSQMPPGGFGVTSELSMSYLRPASVESKTLIARSRVIDVGRSLGLSEATVEDASGQLLAHSTSRYFLRHIEVPKDTPFPEPIDPPSYDTPDPYQRALYHELPNEEFLKLAGLEYFRKLVAGELQRTPFAELIDLHAREAEEGVVSFSIRAREWLCSPARTIYGGVLAFLCDGAMTAAIGTTLPAQHSSAALDLKVQFLRPGIADGTELRVNGSVVHRGRNLAVTRAEVLNAEGKALVLATGSSLVLQRPWSRVAVADTDSADE
jgi:uncharacterized protein (TIGR00369 family)